MSWYAQTQIGESTLLVAFANLLQKLGAEGATPDFIEKSLAVEDMVELDWASATIFNSRVMPFKIGDYNTWPDSDNAIVCFQSTDRENNVIFNYCLVASHLHETIIDSLDGREKPAFTFGRPISWASFALLPDEEDDLPVAKKPKNEREYISKPGESIWAIARKFNIPAEELIEHNGIEDPINLEANTVIRLPIAPVRKSSGPVTEFVPYPEAVKMHINRADGASKHTFGRVRDENDIRPSGPRYPLNYTVDVIGEAHVPCGDDTIVFYMDKLSMGEYARTGRINYTTGYKVDELSDGQGVRVTRPTPTPAPERLEMPQAPPDEVDIVLDADSSWKASYVEFPNGPEPFLVNTEDGEELELFDYGGRAASVKRPFGARLLISGVFDSKAGKQMLRPYGSAKDGMWHGIDPEDMIAEVEAQQEAEDMTHSVEQEAELHETKFDLATRVKLRKNGYIGQASRVSLQERYVDVPLAWTQSKLMDAKLHIDKTKTNIKEKLWK